MAKDVHCSIVYNFFKGAVRGTTQSFIYRAGKSHWHVSVFVQRRREMSVPTQPLELLSFPSPTARALTRGEGQ